MVKSLGPTALMLGNFVVATTVLAPAGMLHEVASGLQVTIRQASYLAAIGSVALCIGSPLGAWLTSRMDRRILLAGCLVLIAIAHGLSAILTSFPSLLVVRVLMVLAAAPYTAQAAGAVRLIVPEDKQAGAIVYVFLGWLLALAIGLPAVAILSDSYGWQAPHRVLGLCGLIAGLLVMAFVPGGLRVPPVILSTWGSVFRHRGIMLLLLLTTLINAGQFVIVTFIDPLLVNLTHATSHGVGMIIALYGAMGIVGSIVAAQHIRRWGVFKTIVVHTTVMVIGMFVWAIGAGSFAAMATGIAIWGSGFAAGSSLQQARLASAEPSLASASIALNTSTVYVGQAIGATLGGILYEHGQLVAMGYVAAGFMLLALPVLYLTRPKAIA